MSRKGFTLIELLVVISIIGILSTVVIASLTSARSKGSDAAVKANLAQVRLQAEIYYEANGYSFGTDYANSSQCTFDSSGIVTSAVGVFNDTTVKRALTQVWVNSNNSDSNFALQCAIGGSGQRWGIKVIPLKGTGTSWCVDNSGFNGTGNLILQGGEIAKCN